MPLLPEGYSIRPGRHEDIPSIVAVGRACDLEISGEADVHESWIADDWRRPRFDPATDSWVATGPGEDVVAAAYTWDEEPATVFDANGWVRPDHRGRGLGSALVAAVEARALRDVASEPNGAAPRVHQSFDAADAGAAALFGASGYAPVREFLHLQIDLRGDALDRRPDPEGIRIRPRAAGDDAAVFAAVDEAFREHWGYRSEPYEDWLEEWRGSRTFDPSLWIVATDGNEVVGAALSQEVEGRGWIGDLAVRGAWRRRGVGEALLRAAFATFARRGVTTVGLNVDRDNTTGATRLYERAGMHVRRRWTVSAKTLVATGR